MMQPCASAAKLRSGGPVLAKRRRAPTAASRFESFSGEGLMGSRRVALEQCVANLRSSSWIRRLSVVGEVHHLGRVPKAFVFSDEDGGGKISTVRRDVPHDISVQAVGRRVSEVPAPDPGALHDDVGLRPPGIERS
jgi:hypothetical protein